MILFASAVEIMSSIARGLERQMQDLVTWKLICLNNAMEQPEVQSISSQYQPSNPAKMPSGDPMIGEALIENSLLVRGERCTLF